MIVIVFVLAVITEMCYTGYAYYVSQGDTVRAPIAAGLIGVFKGILVVAYVRDPIMIAVLAVGQVCGTYLMLRFIQR